MKKLEYNTISDIQIGDTVLAEFYEGELTPIRCSMYRRIGVSNFAYYKMNRYPKHCGECPCYREKPYTCHNERGYEGHCTLGYMMGYDMRDFNSAKKFDGCKMDTNPNVIIKDMGESRNKNEMP